VALRAGARLAAFLAGARFLVALRAGARLTAFLAGARFLVALRAGARLTAFLAGARFLRFIPLVTSSPFLLPLLSNP